MAWKADDGSEHTNRMTMVSKNSSLRAKGPQEAAKPRQAPSPAPKAGGEIMRDPASDPAAAQHIMALKQLGYTGDEVANAMDGTDGVDDGTSGDSGSEATQAAPMQIPGM